MPKIPDYYCVSVQQALSILLLALSFPLQTYAAPSDEQSIGRVSAVKGNVQVVRADGQIETLLRRSSIYSGDKVVTETDQFIQLRMIDSAIVAVACDSALTFAQYDFQDSNSDGVNLHFHYGKVRTITGTVQRSNYLFDADLAQVKISGTDFEVLKVKLDRNQGSNWLAGFAIYDGAIEVINEEGSIQLASNTGLHAGEVETAAAPKPVINLDRLRNALPVCNN